MPTYNDGLLLVPEPLLAEEDDGRLEDEAHGVKLEAFLDLAQEVRDVQPLDAAVVQQIARTQVNDLGYFLLFSEQLALDIVASSLVSP